jgi:DNA-binding NarL/FixJ family response regulator
VNIRVVVGDDDFLVRQGVERALAIQDDLEVVASCGHYVTPARPGEPRVVDAGSDSVR